jgi:hypothetical protein
MNLINQEIIGNTATLYMKDGSVKSGRILGIRSEVAQMIALELEIKVAKDPFSRTMYSDITEFLDAASIEAIDPYAK